MSRVDAAWTCADLAKVVCDKLVAQGRLKEKPTFIREDRERKCTQVFESAKLNGAKMNSLNGRGVEVAVRNATQGEAWVDDLVKVLKGMMDYAAAKDTKSQESPEMKKMRDKRLQLTRDDIPGGMAKGLTNESLAALGVAGHLRQRADDERSMASSFSQASTVPLLEEPDHKKIARPFLDLINKGDNVKELKEMLNRSGRLADDGATWLIGGSYKLSEWHIEPVNSRYRSKSSYPFLMWAAMLGCPHIVESLINNYKCSAAITQKVHGKDIGVNALHLAAYFGHSTVVRFLLQAGTDPTQHNTLWADSTPLDSAKEGKKNYLKNPEKAATLSGYVGTNTIDFRERDAGWPQYDVIIDLLSSSVESQKVLLKSEEEVVCVDFDVIERSQQLHIDVNVGFAADETKKGIQISTKVLFESDDAVVCVDFDTVERSQQILIDVAHIQSGEILDAAQDFADLVSPIFHVELKKGELGEIFPDGLRRPVNLIVELKNFEAGINTDSLVFIKKSSSSDDAPWCGVSGGEFSVVPTEKGPRLRGQIKTDSFSLWGVAFCHVKVAAHHIQIHGQRKLTFIFYSGEPTGCYPIPRNLDDPLPTGPYAPMLSGFFTFQHNEGPEGPLVLKDGLEFEIKVECGGVLNLPSKFVQWTRKPSLIAYRTIDIDVQDVALGTSLQVKIRRKSTARLFRPQNGIREYILEQKYLPLVVSPVVAGATNVIYWGVSKDYTDPQNKIICGYCLGFQNFLEPPKKTAVKNVGEIKLGNCCKDILPGLTGSVTAGLESMSQPSHGASAAFSSASAVGSSRLDNEDRLQQLESSIAESVRSIHMHNQTQDFQIPGCLRDLHEGVDTVRLSGSVDAHPLLGAAGAASSASRMPRIEGFFCKKIVHMQQLVHKIHLVENADAIDKDAQLTELKLQMEDSVDGTNVHDEAEKLKNLFTHARPVFEVDVHPQPSFQIFADCMRSARQRNVRILHFAGHGKSKCGFFWLNHEALEYEEVPIDTVAGLIKTEAAEEGAGTIECVVLNACESEEMGTTLRTAGVCHVLCWRSEVNDNTASKFALEFYKSLDFQNQLQPLNYTDAFQQAVCRMPPPVVSICDTRHPAKHLAVGAVDYVCLLSQDGNKYPDTGRIRGTSEELRNWNPPMGQNAHLQFARQSGHYEKKVLKYLKFNLILHGEEIGCKGHGFDSSGYLLFASLKAIGVSRYCDLWCQPYQEGKIVEAARKLLSGPSSSHFRTKVQLAQDAIKMSVFYRQLDVLAWRHISKGYPPDGEKYPSESGKENLLKKGSDHILQEYHQDVAVTCRRQADDPNHTYEIDARWQTFEALGSLLKTHTNTPAHTSPVNSADAADSDSGEWKTVMKYK